MPRILSIENVAFVILGYPMSYIELIGTVLYLWSVWLIAQRRILTWPIGIVSVLLYMMLFYQIQLYSDSLEQVYYLVAGVYGWWRWSHSLPENEKFSAVIFSSITEISLWASVTIGMSARDWERSWTGFIQ